MSKFLYNNSFKFRTSRHILFFLVTVMLFALILFVQNGSKSLANTIWITFLNALFFFGYAYITIFLLIPEFLLKKKAGWFILLFILVGIGLSAIKLVVSDHIFYSSISPENMQRSGIVSLRFIVVNTKDMTFIVALFCIGKYAKDYLYAEKIRRSLEKQNKEAQGKLLQSQFDPHFLFNTINNLYALSLLNPMKTQEVISRIKKVLSYIIKESQKNFVELKDEIALVENYIQLEKLRYGKRLKVDFLHSGETVNSHIPPMVLFFLVENCFKHGSSLDAGTPWIKIQVKSKPEKIEISASNSKPKSFLKSDINEKDGPGLKNLKKRLAIVYSNDGFKLKTDNRETTYTVELKLKVKDIEITTKKYR